MLVSENCQKTMYVQHGGQPGHLSAWKDHKANYLTNNFFHNVLPVMENGYIRPRYDGYLHSQDHAGIPLQRCVMNNENEKDTLNKMNEIYRVSIQKKQLTDLL